MVTTAEVIETVLRVITDFANLDWQYREWVLGETNPYACSTESICLLGDAYFYDILDKYVDQFNFSEKEFRVLNEFRTMLEEYEDQYLSWDDVERMVDPKWHEVVKKAQEVLNVFKNYDFTTKKKFIF
jgi:hypothetical protein